MPLFGLTAAYRTAAAASITALLDREDEERSRPLGRALDLGCGRGRLRHEGLLDGAGHNQTSTTGLVYRHQILPALTRSAEIMDDIFG